MKQVPPRLFWRVFLASTVVVSALAFYQTIEQTVVLGIALWSSKWPLFLGVLTLNLVFASLGLWRVTGEALDRRLRTFGSLLGRPYAATIGIAIVAVAFALVWIVRLYFLGDLLPQTFPFLWFFLWLSLIEAAGLALVVERGWHVRFAAVLVVQAVAFHVYGHLAAVTDFPFSIGYSEAGRHYYASLLFAPSLYGIQPPLPFLHPSRYLLMSIPFLVHGMPLWFHRLWQTLLWLGLTAAASFALTRRLRLPGKWLAGFVGGWAFLYFLQGAVYYHLQVSVIIVLVGVSSERPWRSMLALALSSLWAGISRINWLPVPAMLAIAVYILETPIRRAALRYWLVPLLWGAVGLLAAFASQAAYAAVAGNADLQVFGSSLMSTLLWNRLLPNETFPPGILVGISIVAAPLVLGIWQSVQSRRKQLSSARWLVLLTILATLFLGGLVVSIKIGGGADLHNLDAFMVVLALAAAYFFAGKVKPDAPRPQTWGSIQWPALYLAILIPAAFSLSKIGAPFSYDMARAESDVRVLQEKTSEAVRAGGEVLFVSERQLLTFADLEDIPLVPEYEQMELMEMAMSGNRPYLDRYYSDLKRHRFALIVAEEQKFTQQQRGAFGEENRAWVRFVGAPLLCAYKPVASLRSANVQVFEPRARTPECTDPFLE